MAAILVTGGAGFIGSHTVERLVREGHAVTALDNLSAGAWSNLAHLGPALTRVELDVRDGGRFLALVRAAHFDAIVHLAAIVSVPYSIEQPGETFATNVTGALNVLEAARLCGVRRVVLASSAAVYGRTPPLPVREDAPLCPASPYAAQKAAAELLAAAYRQSHGIETVVLRYFNVYGSRQPPTTPYAGVVPAFIAALRERRTITVYGDGEQTRDFIHVSDIAAINLRAALGPDPGGEPLNVGTGMGVSVLGVLGEVRALLKTDAAVVFAPERAGDVRYSRADISRLHARLGYTPRVAFRDGLAALVQAGVDCPTRQAFACAS
jgi:UDP-glucose 4-epimerase